MKKDKLICFALDALPGVSFTHAYHIINDFPVHFHTNYNVGITESGSRDVLYRGEKYIFHPDDIFDIQPFEPHNCKTLSDAEHSYKMISFNLDKSYYFPSIHLKDRALLSCLRELHTIAEFEKASSKLKPLYDMIISILLSFAIESNSEADENNLPKITEANIL